MFLPSKKGIHKTSTIHRGPPDAEAKKRLLKQMSDAFERGTAEGWTQKQYLKKLKDIVFKERRGLRSGKLHLNSAQ